MDNVSCDLCGSNNAIPYLTSTDRFSGNEFTFSKCSNCNLIYLTPRPSLAEIINLYPDDYEAYAHAGEPISTTGFRDSQRILRLLVTYLDEYHPSKGKLLDVGCATGRFLDIARSQGWQVFGIEVIDKAADYARQHYKLEVLTTDLVNANLLPDSIDVITLWDVLEHLPSPRMAMHKIHNTLRQDGMIFFSIPNLNSYDRKLFGSEWIGWDPPRHFTLFDQSTITRLLDETGFEIINQRCLSGGKGTFFLSLDRIIKKKPSLRWMMGFYPAINLVLWPYRKFSYLNLRGPIMYYAARKIK